MRMEAKMGLREMEQDGRIGGEPVEPNKGMTEADLAGLEQMMRTGVANGGLMDKMAYTAMNDPLVNKKLNESGMTVGFATGGMAQSPYNDPTRVDQVIGQFMQMTKNNPGIMDELAKRGITINRTPATNQPTQMQAQNAPAQTTNPVTNQAPIKAAEGTYLDPLSMTGLGTTIQPNSLNTTNTQNQSYITSPTSISSMYGIPGGSYFYQGPGVPKSPEEVEKAPVAPVASTTPVCAPGTVYDEESNSCVPELEPTRDKDNMDGIGGTEMSTPYVEKGWRVQATEQLDWSNPKDFDAYMKELSKPQEKISGLAKGLGVAIPGWGPAMIIGQKMERKATVNKIKAMENIANLIGDTVSAASAVKAGESYKANMTEDQKAFADTQNGEGYTITLVNQIMGKGFLDDVEGTRGNGFHSVADLQNMPQSKKDELKAAIDANNKKLRSEIEITPTSTTSGGGSIKLSDTQKKKIAAEQKRESDSNKVTAAQSAVATKGVATTGRKDSNEKSAGQTGYKSALKQRQEAKKSANDFTASKVKSYTPGKKFSGGFAKGGLMKKPNKK